MHSNSDIDAKNEAFWDELCGTALATHLGITDRSVESLKRFDDAYLDFYPYLLTRIPVASFRGKHVLEIGLGYGTLGQKIVESGADYFGLDIAHGPVAMMNHRLNMLAKLDSAQKGSMLDCPFADNTFDIVVSVGCFHHTGNLQRCIDEAYRVLKPGGRAYVMVYNKFSYRNWLGWPMSTFKALLSKADINRALSASQRAAYDASSGGEAAPETVFASIAELRQMFRQFSLFEAHKENWGGYSPKGIPILPRKPLLRIIGRSAGLDIYTASTK